MFPTDKDYALAKVLLDHSVKIKAKEKVLIVAGESGLPLAKAVFAETLKRGAYPMLDVTTSGTDFTFFSHANDWQLNYIPKDLLLQKYAWADAFVRIVAEDNARELAQIEPVKLTKRMALTRPISDVMIDKGRWVLTWYPTAAMAQDARMSLEELRNFYFDSCLVDYDEIKRGLKKLEQVLDKGKLIHVVGQQTDLWVKIEGRLSQMCYGEYNMPDGEVFLAPVSDGVDGEVFFEFPTLAMGHEVSGIHLEFQKGKVVTAKANVGNDFLQQMLETDEGARYLGEFAIGANYKITRGMLNTLFDEKIGGTVHMALGRAYKDKRGGGENYSGIHWDLVKDMRLPGSVLTIDDRIVLKEGKLKV